jgi:hypothetical protein
MLLITTRKCGTDARRSSVLAVARSFVNLPLLAGCGDAGAWPGNPQGVSTWRRLDANLIRRRGHERVTRVDSSPKVDLLQWRLWFATRSKRDRHFTASPCHEPNVLCQPSRSETGQAEVHPLQPDEVHDGMSALEKLRCSPERPPWAQSRHPSSEPSTIYGCLHPNSRSKPIIH